MPETWNELGQSIGESLPFWKPPPMPSRVTLEGRFCRLEPLDAERHAEALDGANRLDTEDRGWTYLSSGPFQTY
ncbi:MAG: GNAT family N-acetyltransferase, partial [Janthinobacterium lividum]